MNIRPEITYYERRPDGQVRRYLWHTLQQGQLPQHPWHQVHAIANYRGKAVLVELENGKINLPGGHVEAGPDPASGNCRGNWWSRAILGADWLPGADQAGWPDTLSAEGIRRTG